MGQAQGNLVAQAGAAPQPLPPPVAPPVAGANAMGAAMNLNFAPPPRWGNRGRRRGGLALNRVRYTEGQKENAIRLLNLGLSYRQVARMMSPHCSSGTPHRWRREHIRRQEQRRRMDEMRRRRMF